MPCPPRRDSPIRLRRRDLTLLCPCSIPTFVLSMMRPLLILWTVLALLAGSIGMPVTLHSCQMKKMNRVASKGCGKCSMPATTKDSGSESSNSLRATPCCSSVEQIQQTDPTFFPRLDRFEPVLTLVAFLPTVLIEVAPLHAPAASAIFDRPPPLAAAACTTYLMNSTFLI